jgi:hypothetical protein
MGTGAVTGETVEAILGRLSNVSVVYRALKRRIESARLNQEADMEGARPIVNGFKGRDLLGAAVFGVILGFACAVGVVARLGCQTWCGW